jgi:hypothetical protein
MSKIEQEIDKIKIGDPTRRATGLGPVVNKRAHESYALRRGTPEPRRGSSAAASSRRKACSGAGTTWNPCSRKRIRPTRSGSRKCSADPDGAALPRPGCRHAPRDDTDMGLTAGFLARRRIVVPGRHQAGVTYANRGAGATDA